mgnify:CR=1 FL=1
MSDSTARCKTVHSSNDKTNKLEIDSKAEKIQLAISKYDKDKLRKLSVSKYGLVNTEIRAKAWPILIGCHFDEENNDAVDGESSGPDSVNSQYLAEHRDELQVQKDVDRSFVHFPKGMSEQKEKELKLVLDRLIVRMLREVPELSYYQGYHDIASVVAIVYGEDERLGFKFLYKLTLEYLRDHMLRDVYPTTAQLKLIPDIVLHMDAQLGRIVNAVPPMHAISSIITLFSHDLDDFEAVCLLWDPVFARRDPAFPLYLYSALLVGFKKSILEQLDSLEPGITKHVDKPANKDYIHAVLSRAVSQNLNKMDAVSAQLCINLAIELAVRTENELPFTKLSCASSISRFSCLRHQKSAAKMLSLQCAEVQVELQKRHRREKMVRHLRSLSASCRSLANSIGKMPLLLRFSLGVGLLTILIGLALGRNIDFPRWLSKAGKSTNSVFRNALDNLNG